MTRAEHEHMTRATDTIAILAFPDRPPVPSPGSALGRLLVKLDKVARHRRNPRSPEYMRRLAASGLPDAEIVDVDGAIPRGRIAAARHIVLLWPDAIGYGWAPIERAVLRSKDPGATISALSGRRRTIGLNPGTLLAFRLRRAVERLWLGEAVFAAALLIQAPFLVLWDFARGRR